MTATKEYSIQDVLNQGNENQMADAFRQAKVGYQMSPIKVTFVGLASAAAQDITTAAALAAATINSGFATDPDVQPTLPPIGEVAALRVTAGAAVAGPRVMLDSGAVPAASATGLGGAPGGTAKLSDDGRTITFEAAVTAFVLIYWPAPAKALTTIFAPMA